MNEARRILRLILPGAAYVTTLIVLGWIGAATEVESWANAINSNVAAVLGALLASGGFGILISAIHHSWFSSRLFHRRSDDIDYSQFIEDLRQQGSLTFVDIRTGGALPISRLSRNTALIVATQLWNTTPATEPEWKRTVPRLLALIDMVHYTGAVRVASALAWLSTAFLLISMEPKDFSWIRFVIMNVVGAVLFVVHGVNFKQSRFLAQRSVEHALSDLIGRQEKKPLAIILFPEAERENRRSWSGVLAQLLYRRSTAVQVMKSLLSQLRPDPNNGWPRLPRAGDKPDEDRGENGESD